MESPVNAAHETLIAAKRRLFDALSTRQRAKAQLGKAQQRWAGTVRHEDLARAFIATGRAEAAAAGPKPPGFPCDQRRGSHGQPIDQTIGQSARRAPRGGFGVRGSRVSH